ncbi:helicase C-terminal domain-containing protein [Metallosphaera sedula]|uniref:helicase C-terminal domain-containing protein n=1 Tax=Metallosphaera sedula TaxID=43687 RepID=UPI0020BEE4E9|nr:helicase C-terminal domain-containing protein [Metallosphaera sedula]BBL46100.1 ATP-dependent DNA helicase [Metallosphaera sedula]
MERTVIKLRQYQEAVIERALKALDDGESVIINSPTGTGKTLMGLIIGKRYSEEHGFSFDILVRTRSQYTPWEDNARKVGLKFTGLMAKSLFCKFTNKEYYEICEFCGVKKNEDSGEADHQHHWVRMYARGMSCSKCTVPKPVECVIVDETTGDCLKEEPSKVTIEELQNVGIFKFATNMKKRGICPYTLMLSIESDFRIFSYIYYFLNLVETNELLIFDEAHNLELQELMRTTVSVYDFLRLSKSEKEKDILRWAFKRFVETEGLEAEIKDVIGEEMTIEELLLKYEDDGEELVKKCRFVLKADDSFYKEKTDKYYRVIARDPSVLLSKLNAERYILMSGTMPSERYLREVWGLEKFEYIDVWKDYYDQLKDFYHMNINVVEADLTYKSRNGNTYREVAEFIKQHLRNDGVNLVAVTSKQMMADLSHFLYSDFIEKDGKIDFGELQQLPDGAVILAYEGGRLTEGIELTNEGKSRIKSIFIVGFPYPEYKDRYLNSVIDYLAHKKGLDGESKESFRWFVFKEKAIIKVRQTMGRAIRGPKDEADIWLIDKRFTYKDIAQRLGIELM